MESLLEVHYSSVKEAIEAEAAALASQRAWQVEICPKTPADMALEPENDKNFLNPMGCHR